MNQFGYLCKPIIRAIIALIITLTFTCIFFLTECGVNRTYGRNREETAMHYGPVGLKLKGGGDKVRASAVIIDENEYYELVKQGTMSFCWDSDAGDRTVYGGSEYEIDTNGSHYLNVYISDENGSTLYCTMEFEVDSIDEGASGSEEAAVTEAPQEGALPSEETPEEVPEEAQGEGEAPGSGEAAVPPAPVVQPVPVVPPAPSAPAIPSAPAVPEIPQGGTDTGENAAGNSNAAVPAEKTDTRPPEISVSQEKGGSYGEVRMKVRVKDDMSGIFLISLREEGTGREKVLAGGDKSLGNSAGTEVMLANSGFYVFSAADAAGNVSEKRILLDESLRNTDLDAIKDNDTARVVSEKGNNNGAKISSGNGSTGRNVTVSPVKNNTGSLSSAEETEKGKKEDGGKESVSSAAGISTGGSTGKLRNRTVSSPEAEDEEDSETVSSNTGLIRPYLFDEEEDTDSETAGDEESGEELSAQENRAEEVLSDEDMLPGLLNENRGKGGISVRTGKIIMIVLILLLLAALTLFLLFKKGIITLPEEEPEEEKEDSDKVHWFVGLS